MHERRRALNKELAGLRAEAEASKAPDNAAAYLARVQEERDELLREVKELREALVFVAPGKGGPTPLSRMKAQLAAERSATSARANADALDRDRDSLGGSEHQSILDGGPTRPGSSGLHASAPFPSLSGPPRLP